MQPLATLHHISGIIALSKKDNVVAAPILNYTKNLCALKQVPYAYLILEGTLKCITLVTMLQNAKEAKYGCNRKFCLSG